MNNIIQKIEKYLDEKDLFRKMAKTGVKCPKCGLWLPKSEVKKGIKCPECGTFCKIK